MLDRWTNPLLASGGALAVMFLAGLTAYLVVESGQATALAYRESAPAVESMAIPLAPPAVIPKLPVRDHTPWRTAPVPAPAGERMSANSAAAFRIVPGATIAEVLRRLSADARVTFDLAGVDGASLMRHLGLEPADAEGYFLPGTYATGDRRAASGVLREAHERMRKVLMSAWQSRTAGLPYTVPYDALIVASIVEKETARADDRPRVAGVFTRRLRQGMRLQADPTVIYGLGSTFEGSLTRADLARDGPFNTYTRHGLPPTPISLPGPAAIDAAMRPGNGTSLYFVARGDGSSEFSDTLAQHRVAIRRFLLRGD